MVFLSLFSDPIEYGADELRAAIKGLRTNEDILIKIIASRPPNILKPIIDKCQEKFKRSLKTK